MHSPSQPFCPMRYPPRWTSEPDQSMPESGTYAAGLPSCPTTALHATQLERWATPRVRPRVRCITTPCPPDSAALKVPRARTPSWSRRVHLHPHAVMTSRPQVRGGVCKTSSPPLVLYSSALEATLPSNAAEAATRCPGLTSSRLALSPLCRRLRFLFWRLTPLCARMCE